MSSFSEEVECPKCGGDLFHVSTDTRDPEDNYGYCLDCGYGYSTVFASRTLEELNEERKSWELPPLTELRKQTCEEQEQIENEVE